MRGIILLWSAACVAAAGGCAVDPYARLNLGESRDVVVGGIEAMGGIGAWRSLGPINATAVVTTYDDAGRATVNEQQQKIDLNANVIKASANVRQGRWFARVTGDGKSRFRAKGFKASKEMRSRIVATLRTNLHRFGGALNLLGDGERPVGSQPVRVAGKDMIRVPVEGGKAGVAAYYFDADSRLLAMVTTGADAPGRPGTVTTYVYRTLPDGLVLPSRISVMKIGRYTLVGDEPLLEVEYRRMSLKRGETIILSGQ